MYLSPSVGPRSWAIALVPIRVAARSREISACCSAYVVSHRRRASVRAAS